MNPSTMSFQAHSVPASTAARTSSPKVPALQATRVSERQATRMKAKSQMKTPRISTAKWVIGGTRSDERKWIERIVEYLHLDPVQESNPQILRFMLKDWPTLTSTLHTVATLEKVKALLVANAIPYLRKMQSVTPNLRVLKNGSIGMIILRTALRNSRETMLPTPSLNKQRRCHKTLQRRTQRRKTSRQQQSWSLNW